MTKRQQLILTYFISKSLYFGIGISSIISISKSSSLLSMVLGIIIGLIILLYITKKDMSKIYKKWYGKLPIIFIASIFLNNSVLAFTNLSSNFYLSKTPPLVLLIPLLLLILYGMKKGLNTIARVGEYLCIISIALTLITSISSLFLINYDNFIIYDFNFQEFIKSTIITVVYSTSPTILLLSLIDNYDRKSIILGYLLGSFALIDTLFNTLGILGDTLSNYYHYPEYIALKKIRLLKFLENLENILSLKWFIDLLMVSLLSAISINKIFNNKLIYLISIIMASITYIFFINNYQNTIFIYNTTYLFLILPCLTIILLTKKRIN